MPGAVPPPPAPALHGFAFAELAVDGVSGAPVAGALAALGFTHTGQHRTKPVQLWEQGEARVLLNASVVAPGRSPGSPRSRRSASRSPTPPAAAQRAEALLAPVLPRTRGPAEADLSAVAAPDGTAVFFCPHRRRDGWLADFPDTAAPGRARRGPDRHRPRRR